MPEKLEKYSSAVTLSDMEIFIFPELLYSLVLANIMSPRLWTWRDDPWFRKIDRMSPYRKVLRLKQFIIDHYEFNLDLDTWGLTTQKREMERFQDWVDRDTLAQSNALFGYEGDKYYFDLDIRKHFGLDKYSGQTIPYWKTETLEAMDAFRHKDGYRGGAGECVSLSTLYAAALFVVCKIPLENIFLMATPLHSQNFVDVNEGLLTNNRRIVTQRMWFNGTELSAKAQRALRNERVTVVAHNSGYTHILYPEATIDPQQYEHFKDRLGRYLTADINAETIANFLRDHSKLQTCFQIRHDYHGKPRYIAAEKVYAYEHSSSYLVSDKTRDKLLDEIDEYEFFSEPLEGRIPLNKFDDFFKDHRIDLADESHQQQLKGELNCYNKRSDEIIRDLISFTRITPQLPDDDKPKEYKTLHPIRLTTEMERDDIMAYIESLRESHLVADLSFYAFRDLSRTHWQPFVKAAMERNPVVIEATRDLSDEQLVSAIQELENQSIYDGSRVAQPDEVWNYQRGDGLEKGICLANAWKARHPDAAIALTSENGNARIELSDHEVVFPTGKGLEVELEL